MLLGWFRRTKKVEELSIKELTLIPWRRKRVTHYLADDVVDFIGELSENTQVPRSQLIDVAIRRFRKSLEDGIESQEVEVPERIIHDLKHSEVMRRFLEENVQLAINYKSEPEQNQDQQQEVE